MVHPLLKGSGFRVLYSVRVRLIRKPGGDNRYLV